MFKVKGIIIAQTGGYNQLKVLRNVFRDIIKFEGQSKFALQYRNTQLARIVFVEASFGSSRIFSYALFKKMNASFCHKL